MNMSRSSPILILRWGTGAIFTVVLASLFAESAAATIQQLNRASAMEEAGSYYAQVKRPRGGAVLPKGTVAPPPKGTVAPPPKGTVAPPPKGTVAPPPKGTVAPPPKGTVAPPPKGTVAPPPKGTVAPPPKGTVAPPPKGTVAPPFAF
ncbi:hypothetical protein [Leptolyngbya sp. O-77]|uniref:hypothetical protein n=1 Tax=Leptolyngbya sp. O-77 TaxID=1080068 RepID=UPI0012E37E95|nr:hypothetical protein [Leptolyngbya sp. O-77]